MEVTNSNKKPRAAVYLRKSTVDDRPGENRSFARQMADMSKIISEFEVVAEFQEKIGISASRFSDQERPEWDNALAGLGFDYDVLVGAQFDRLARRGISELVKIYDACEQGHGNGRVITGEWDSDSSEARILGPIIAELARAESEKLHDRIKGGKEVQKAKNDWLGGPAPWAWDITRDADGIAQYRIIPEHQAACIEAARRFLEGASYSKLKRWAETQGLKTQFGNSFCNSTWRQIFINPSMAGQRVVGGKIITDDGGTPIQFTEPVLPPDLHAKLKAAMIKRAKTVPHGKSPGGQAVKGLLSKFVKCGGCGGNMGVDNDRYRCISAHHDKGWATKRSTLDETVSMEVMKLIGNLVPGSELSMELIQQVQRHFDPQDRSRRSEVEANLVEINDRLKKLNKKYLQGGIEPDEFAELEEMANEMKRELVEELLELPAPPTDLSDLIDWDRETGLIGEGSFWASLTFHQKRDVIGALIQYVEMEPLWLGRGRVEDIDGQADRLHIEWIHKSNVTELKAKSRATDSAKSSSRASAVAS